MCCKERLLLQSVRTIKASVIGQAACKGSGTYGVAMGLIILSSNVLSSYVILTLVEPSFAPQLFVLEAVWLNTDKMLYVVKKPMRKARKKGKYVYIIIFIVFATALYVAPPLRSIANLPTYCLKMISPSRNSKDTPLSHFKHSDTAKAPKALQQKCGLPEACPIGMFAFSIRSGAANVIPPAMCFNGDTIMSGAMRNTGDGLNIAVINARTGDVMRTNSFNMWHGEIKLLVPFLKAIEDNTFVLIATFDDGATKMTDEARTLIVEFGSSKIKILGFRDNWIFAGGKGFSRESPFEQYLKNNRSSNKYDAWPELLEMSGCLPKKLD